MRTERLLLDTLVSSALIVVFFFVGLAVAPTLVELALAATGAQQIVLTGPDELGTSYVEVALAFATPVLFTSLVGVAYRFGARRAPQPRWMASSFGLLLAATAFGMVWTVWWTRAFVRDETLLPPMIGPGTLDLAGSAERMALRLAIILCAIAFFFGRRRPS